MGNGRNAPTFGVMFVGRPEAAAAELAPWHETFRGGLGFDQPRTYLITRAVR